jgi:hypothetical protein
MRLDDEGITRLGTESSKVEGDALSHRPTHQVVARVYGVDASELAPRGRLVLPPRHIQDESVLHQFIEVDVERDVHENPASAAGTLLCCRNAVAADIVGTPIPAFMRVSGAKRSSQAENAGSIPVIRSKRPLRTRPQTAVRSQNPSAVWPSTLTSRCEVCANYSAGSCIIENRCDAQRLRHSGPHHE